MAQYKILLVDDEVDVRESIARTVDWEACGFSLCGGAAGALEALEMAKEHVAKNGQITLAEMRDLMGASRKFAVAILEYWDKRGITKKVGDARTFK